ncbi:PREDICTED: ceramide phosphoethanolamine synthase [Vollenhovia emeryi]|uniref:ceramide phosphoethanolamine synthase n=1 Tax=Vollenhovia emeryi TaxID=411798 RepID=UPI0005F37D4B|nr:PREDICTED: ceramide phosphoethanolamine synthase [Vollenhovia emeryi]
MKRRYKEREMKTCLAFLLLLPLYLIGMDLLLYFRVQNYDVRPRANDTASPYRSAILCDLNPICTVTVKAMMLDHPNHYILTPLASLVDYLLDISRSWTWLTPNAISVSHVVIAVIGARCIARASIFSRRVGVALFQVRAWMDDLDGYVARTRLDIRGERSDVGSIGFFVDGICDGLGCVALIVALFVSLKRTVGYELPHRAVSSNSAWKSPLCNVTIVTLHFSLTSIAWNRFISVYQDLLDADDIPPMNRQDLYDRQTVVLRSSAFWAITLVWKMFNFHAIMDYVLLAIFLPGDLRHRIDKYVRLTWLQLPAVLLLLVLVSELHYVHAYAYVKS